MNMSSSPLCASPLHGEGGWNRIQDGRAIALQRCQGWEEGCGGWGWMWPQGSSPASCTSHAGPQGCRCWMQPLPAGVGCFGLENFGGLSHLQCVPHSPHSLQGTAGARSVQGAPCSLLLEHSTFPHTHAKSCCPTNARLQAQHCTPNPTAGVPMQLSTPPR